MVVEGVCGGVPTTMDRYEEAEADLKNRLRKRLAAGRMVTASP